MVVGAGTAGFETKPTAVGHFVKHCCAHSAAVVAARSRSRTREPCHAAASFQRGGLLVMQS